jgi:spore germination protein
MRKIVPFALLSVALLGALAWGNYQGRLRARYEQQIENDYTHAFHDLTWTAENLTDSLAKLQASGSLQRQQRILGDLRVFATHAADAMSGLPLVNSPLEQTSAFLNDLNQVADQYAYQVGKGQPLSADQMAYLGDLQQRATHMEAELHDLGGVADGGRVRWSDLATRQAATVDGTSTPLLKSLDGLDDGMAPKPDQGKPPGIELDRPKADLGPVVQPAYAMDQVRKFMDTPLKEGPTIVQTMNPHDKDLPMPLFTIDATKSTGTKVQVGVSMKGGHVIYLVDGRPLGRATVDRKQAETKVVALLQRLGFGPVKQIDYDQPDGSALLTYVPVQNNVALMTDTIEVTLALDNGEMIGFNAREYWTNHRNRVFADYGTIALTEAQAREKLAKGLKVLESHLAITKNDRQEEIMTYCFKVQSTAGDMFRVFINATTGVEEQIQRLAERAG